MTTIDQVPFAALDDEQHRTPAWQELLKQMGGPDQAPVNAIPRGTYDATLLDATVVRRRDGGGFALRMIAVTERLGRYVLAWRGLSEDLSDPFKLSEGQLRGLRKFAASMGVSTAPVPPVVIVQSVQARVGGAVVARVTHTPVGPQATLSAPTEALITPSTSPVVMVDGRLVDDNGEAHDLEGAAAEAHRAHVQVVSGLRRANEGFAAAAQGCYLLQQSKGWLALGYETLNEYLATPEVTVSGSEFFRLADIWEQYVLDGRCDPALLVAGPSKLEVPLPALKQGVVSAEQAAADAESMTRNDLRVHYRGLLGDEPPQQELRVREPEPPGVTPAGGNPEIVLVPQADLNRALNERDYAQAEIEDLRGQLDQVRTEAEPSSDALSPVDEADLVDASKRIAAVLRRVYDEIGDPKQKRMSAALRQVVLEALQVAVDFGLDGGDA